MSCTLITSKDSPESVLESAMTVCEEHVKLEARIESGEDKAVLKEEFGGCVWDNLPPEYQRAGSKKELIQTIQFN